MCWPKVIMYIPCMKTLLHIDFVGPKNLWHPKNLASGNTHINFEGHVYCRSKTGVTDKVNNFNNLDVT